MITDVLALNCSFSFKDTNSLSIPFKIAELQFKN